MGHACAEPFAFVNAAGHTPCLGGNDRGTVILADDDGQAIFESGQLDAGWNGGDGGTVMFSVCGQEMLIR
jgi:hypothetical protein